MCWVAESLRLEAAKHGCMLANALIGPFLLLCPSTPPLCRRHPPLQCNFVEHRSWKVVYRRYASLFFLVGIDDEEVSCGAECSQCEC